MPPKIYAVILTGSRDAHNPLIAGTGLESKVLLPVFGKPMVQWVFEAIAQCRYAPQIYISSNDPEIEKVPFPGPFEIIPSEARAVASFLGSLQRVPDDAEWVLFVSGDHALVTPEMINYFMDEAIRRDLAMGVGVVGKSTVDAAYPASKRTYMPLKGDAYSGANLYLLHKPRFLSNAHVLETIDSNRKKPWKSIFMLDPISIIQILTRQCDMHQLAEKASKMIGCKTGCVIMPFAEACMDIDKESDRVIAELILPKRQQATAYPETALP